MPSRGRPPKPLDRDAPPAAARIGAKLRALRVERELTQAALGKLVGCTPQHMSEVERARATATPRFIHACDRALDANGALTALLPAALEEASLLAVRRSAARAAIGSVGCGAGPHGDSGEEDVEPTTRLELLGAGTAVALGAPVLGAQRVTRACEIDPGLAEHWMALLRLLGRLDDAQGPREVLGLVQRELRVIAEYRDAARGELRTELMHVEALWAEFGAWLAHDCGDARGRDALMDRALHLAREADFPDLLAWARARQAQWSDAPRALRIAQTGLRTPRANPQSRAWCAARVAQAHARIGDTGSAQRALDEVAQLVALASPPPLRRLQPQPIQPHRLAAWEARCWLALDPRKAIPLLEGLLRDWPRARLRNGGLQQARLALACAHSELDRARAEGAKAFAIYKQTRSTVAARAGATARGAGGLRE